MILGYERTQVDDYIVALRDEVRVLTSGFQMLQPLEGSLAAERAETKRLRSELAERSLNAVASVRIQQMLRLAEDEAAAIRKAAVDRLAEATAEAERIRRAAHVDGEVAAAAHRRENQAEAATILAKARAEAERIVADALAGNKPVPQGSEPLSANGDGPKVNGETRPLNAGPATVAAGPGANMNTRVRTADHAAKHRTTNTSPHAADGASPAQPGAAPAP